jgi:hypothetical protein
MKGIRILESKSVFTLAATNVNLIGYGRHLKPKLLVLKKLIA